MATHLTVFSVELLKHYDMLSRHATWKLFSWCKGDMSKVRQSRRRVTEVLQMLLCLLLRRRHSRNGGLAWLTAVTHSDSTILSIGLESASASMSTIL